MENYNVELHQVHAFYAYLELCNAIGEVPRKDLYDQIMDSTDTAKIEEVTRFIELQHSNFERQKEASVENVKKSFLEKIKEIFNN